MLFLGRENYSPERNCTENEVECTNSYNRKICVKEEVKDVACAQYIKPLCHDDDFSIQFYQTDSYNNQRVASR